EILNEGWCRTRRFFWHGLDVYVSDVASSIRETFAKGRASLKTGLLKDQEWFGWVGSEQESLCKQFPDQLEEDRLTLRTFDGIDDHEVDLDSYPYFHHPYNKLDPNSSISEWTWERNAELMKAVAASAAEKKDEEVLEDANKPSKPLSKAAKAAQKEAEKVAWRAEELRKKKEREEVAKQEAKRAFVSEAVKSIMEKRDDIRSMDATGKWEHYRTLSVGIEDEWEKRYQEAERVKAAQAAEEKKRLEEEERKAEEEEKKRLEDARLDAEIEKWGI
ncbi:hypothetical protein BJ508DRAFT_336994, partial [Ascobolus immersus RN42]